MKISDLYEYDMGIQSKGSNQKVDEPENDQPGDDQQNQQADNKDNQQDAEAQQDFEKALTWCCKNRWPIRAKTYAWTFSQRD